MCGCTQPHAYASRAGSMQHERPSGSNDLLGAGVSRAPRAAPSCAHPERRAGAHGAPDRHGGGAGGGRGEGMAVLGLWHSADLRCLGFVGVFHLSWLTLFNLERLLQPGTALYYFAAITLFLWGCFNAALCSVVTHNALHVPMFKSRLVTNVFQVVLSCAYGNAVSVFMPIHNRSHHRNMQSKKDLTRTTKVQFKCNFLNLLFHGRSWNDAALKAVITFYMKQRTVRPSLVVQVFLEIGAMITMYALAIYADWFKWLYCLFIPHNFAMWFIQLFNFLQHDGCEYDPKMKGYNHSRNFVSKTANWWLLNNGYHTIHHMRPGLHWSKLPEIHDKVVSPHIDKRLEEPSVLAYIWRIAIWPGLRVDYKGKPITISEADDDRIDEPFDIATRTTYDAKDGENRKEAGYHRLKISEKCK